jgi:exopolysaccharide production protein ExoZ
MAVQSKALTSRFDGIQALRFLAAGLVVVTHATLYTHERLDPSIPVWHFGEIGVRIFFAISGFVMVVSTRSLAGTADGWKYFSMRRLIRIVPVYWLATTLNLLVLAVLPGAVLHSKPDPGYVVLSYLFLPATGAGGKIEPVLGVGWTLTFEMFFYAVFAVALWLRRSPLAVCGGVLVALSIASAFRSDNWPAASFYLNPIVLYFLIGMVIAVWVQDRDTGACAWRLGGTLALFTGVTLVLSARAGRFDLWAAVGEQFAVTALLLTVVSAEPWLRRRLPAPVLYLGDASYSLYLFHPMIAPVIPVAMAVVGLQLGLLSVVGCFLAAVIGSVLAYRFVERPAVRWLQDRLPYVRRTPAVTADVAP